MPHHATTIAYIGLGSNLGDRADNIRQAIALLGDVASVTVGRVSSFIDNPAVGGPADSPPFLNAAAEVRTTLSAHALLHAMLSIEAAMGRVRQVKWEPRTIDLDMLLYGNRILSSDDLVVPHPLMHERPFVLEPLAQIAPDAVHPVLQMTVGGLWDDLARNRSPKPE